MGINEKMTSIADGLRILSETSDPMGLDAMSGHISQANETVDEQSALITQIKRALRGKGTATEGGAGDPAKEEQEVVFPTITENGSYEILPDEGKVMSKATVNVEVPERYEEGYSEGQQVGYNEGYSKGFADNEPVLEALNATENGEYTPPQNVDGFSSVTVNVSTEVADSVLLESGTCGENVAWELYDNGLLYLYGEGATYDYTFSTNPFRAYNLPGIKRIIVENGITTVGDYLFSYCIYTTNIIIPDSVTSIGSQAFYNCNNLTSITIGSGLTTIEYYAFSGCNALTSIFYHGTKSEWDSISFGDDVLTEIANATLHCEYEDAPALEAQEKNIDITANGTTEVEPDENKTLSKVIINVNVPTEGSSSGDDTDKLMGIIDGTISEFYIPDNVTTIRPGLFYDCNNLTTAVIPSHITSIGADAFKSCDGLIGVKFDGNITTLDSTAFNNCSNITDIYVPWLEGEVDGAPWSDAKPIVHYNCNASDIIMNKILYISPNSTEIASNAYKGYGTFAEVVIPNSVTRIGSNAFNGCISLNKVTIGNGVITISSNAFTNCAYLTNIIIPNSVTTISSGVFYLCSRLASVVIGTGVNSIGMNAFKDCAALKEITIGDNVATISSSAFKNCTSLTDIYYAGTEEQWNAISISETGNDALFSATIHYNTPM